MDGFGLSSSLVESSFFLAGLVEPGLDPSLPVLTEVVFLDGVVVLCHRLY